MQVFVIVIQFHLRENKFNFDFLICKVNKVVLFDLCPLLFIYLNKAPSQWCLLEKLVLRSQKSTNLVYFGLTILPSCNQAATVTTNNKMILNNLHILIEIITYYFRFKCLKRQQKSKIYHDYSLQQISYHEDPCGSQGPRQTQQKSVLQFWFLQTI